MQRRRPRISIARGWCGLL